MDFFEFCVEFFKLLESVGLCFFAKFGGISAMIYSNPFPVLHFSFSPPHDSKEWMLALLLQFYRSLRLYVFPSGGGVFFFFSFPLFRLGNSYCSFCSSVLFSVLSILMFSLSSEASPPLWLLCFSVPMFPFDSSFYFLSLLTLSLIKLSIFYFIFFILIMFIIAS